MRGEAKTSCRGESPLLADFVASGAEAIWLLNLRTSCSADTGPSLLSRLRLLKLRSSGLAGSSSRE